MNPFETRDDEAQFARRGVSVLVTLFAVSLVGCSSTDPEGEKAGGVPRSANVEIVEKLDEHFGRLMAKEARREAESASVAEWLESAEVHSSGDSGKAAKSEGEDSGETSGSKAKLQLRHRAVLRDVYAARDHELVWFTDRGGRLEPSKATATLRERLVDGVRSHGLWPEEMRLEAVRAVGDASAGWDPAWKELELRDEEREAILDHLSQQGLDLKVAEDMDRLAEIAASSDGPVPRFSEKITARAEAIEKDIRTIARRELRLSDALVEYLVEMRYGNPAWHQPRAWRATLRAGDRGPLRAVSLAGEPFEETPAGLMRVAVQRARKRAMASAKTRRIFGEPKSVGEAMRSVHPPFRQYRRLTRAFVAYRDHVENGGWPEIPAAAEGLEVGSYSPHVRTLKERLWIEGYWKPPARDGTSKPSEGADEGVEAEPGAEPDPYLTKRFGGDLGEALEAYQETHQFYEKGELRGPTLESLNVPARERWNEIRVTLERWRNSRVGADDHYVHINIADFHAEVWRNGEREMRFRIITGSSKQKKNEETGRVRYTRATPRFSDRLQYIVFNPYWNVPESIREKELKPKLAQDPSYFERHNYEIVTDEHGNQFIRQKPGPENALGRVKFLFPNEYSVYMHDTPERFLFNKPTRGYSHGCIRIDEPLEFARYLLDLDGRWTGRQQDEQIEEWLKKKEEKWLTLRQTLPVHIEYFVARVDDEGRANFLADIYDLDEPRLARVADRLEKFPDNYDLPKREVDELMEAALAGELE